MPVGTAAPWWDIFPKTPKAAVTATLQTPDIIAGGVGATVFKSITKTGGIKLGSALIGGGVGLGLGALLLGGGSQEQKQTAAQDLAQQQKQTQQARSQQRARDIMSKIRLDMKAVAKAKTDVTITPIVKLTPVYNVQAGGDVEIGGMTTETYTHTETHTTTGLTQIPIIPTGQFTFQEQLEIAQAYQAPVISQTQEAKQEGGGTNWAIVAAIGAVAAYFMFGRKKRAG